MLDGEEVFLVMRSFKRGAVDYNVDDQGDGNETYLNQDMSERTVSVNAVTGKLDCSCNEHIGFGTIDRHIFAVLREHPNLSSSVIIDRLNSKIQDIIRNAYKAPNLQAIMPYFHSELLRRKDNIRLFSIKSLWKKSSQTVTPACDTPITFVDGDSIVSFANTALAVFPTIVSDSSRLPTNFNDLQKLSDRLNSRYVWMSGRELCSNAQNWKLCSKNYILPKLAGWL